MNALVDARGLRCPWPVLRLAAAMRLNETVTILVDDPAASAEIAMLASIRGWHYSADGGGSLRVEKFAC